MAKKAISPNQPEQKENLVPVRAVEHFVDGTLGEHFAKYDYRPEWPKDEIRRIPLWLLKRCQQSGGEFEFMRG